MQIVSSNHDYRHQTAGVKGEDGSREDKVQQLILDHIACTQCIDAAYATVQMSHVGVVGYTGELCKNG